ncbi:ABC transporter ATP-binding protein [Desulfotomaculum copahuensis]|uniref:ABC transporter ATP-binding protein n=1 Tax=Desulfotomaculum copahuensis TaxID=1838280 RepID=A0A1B7LEA8_9FIRM|nr:ABC transporter ATP-binding protein [Desulfotomaculum copahuensis]OAT81385.1 ABC transporter ATP-binding protein [Desulfotomaculum copahuensis]
MAFFEVRRIVKNFGGLCAVHEISFSLEKGQVIGLIGPNGSGKTTIFNLINNFFPLTAGEIYFKGKRIDSLPTHKICALGIARTFQVVKPLKRMSVLDNVMAGAFLHTGSTSQARARALEILEFCNLINKRDLDAKKLTIADRKRLEIARALSTDPELLLLDETAAGLNPKETEEAIEVIKKISRSGIAIIIVEHKMKVIMGTSEKIVAINFGREITQGEPREVINHPEVIKAYLGDHYA